MAKPVPAKASNICSLGAKCPVQRALRVHKQYVQHLNDLGSSTMRARAHELERAEFIREVTKQIAKSEPDIWENLLRTSPDPVTGRADGKGKASAFANSFLKARIDEINDDFAVVQAKAERAAETLVKVLEHRSFQDHLLELHSHHFLPSYDLYPDLDFTSAEYFGWRDMDHALALLTEQLAASKAGKSFLEKILLTAPSAQGPAFEDVWGTFSKANSVRGPLGKLTYNLIPVLNFRISEAVKKRFGNGDSLVPSSIVNDPDVKDAFDKMAEKINVPADELRKKISDRAHAFGDRVGEEDVSNLKKLVGRFDDFDQKDFDLKTAAGQTLDDAWWSLTLNVTAFFVSNGPILVSFKDAKTKDLLGMVKDAADLAGSIGKQVEAHKVLREMDSTSATRFAQAAGIAANVLSLLLTLIEMDAALKSADAKKILLTYAGAMVAVGGMVATLVAATMVSGVLTIVGIVLAIVSAILLAEHALAGYLRKTPWGTARKEAGAIHIDRVLDEYYKRVGKLRVAVERDTDGQMLVIESRAMGLDTPIVVTITRPVQRSQQLKVVPGRKSVLPGKSPIERPALFWNDRFLPDHTPRRIQIRRPWDAFETIQADDSTEHTIEATMDIDGNKFNELTFEDDGFEFSFP